MEMRADAVKSVVAKDSIENWVTVACFVDMEWSQKNKERCNASLVEDSIAVRITAIPSSLARLGD